MNDSYFGNIPVSGSPDVCPLGQAEYTDDELQMDRIPKLSNENLTPDTSTGRIPIGALQTHYGSLLSDGVIKQTPTLSVTTPGGGADAEPNVIQQQKNDADLYNMFRDEYCFYEQRYRYALRKFLEKATSRVSTDNADAQKYLTITIRLNHTLNSLIEFMNYVASMRVDTTNSYVSAINKLNADIQSRRGELQSVATMLEQNNATVTVQKEMVGFTAEKNRYMTNQVSVWAALNVLALATIFYVYRSA